MFSEGLKFLHICPNCYAYLPKVHLLQCHNILSETTGLPWQHAKPTPRPALQGVYKTPAVKIGHRSYELVVLCGEVNLSPPFFLHHSHYKTTHLKIFAKQFNIFLAVKGEMGVELRLTFLTTIPLSKVQIIFFFFFLFAIWVNSAKIRSSFFISPRCLLLGELHFPEVLLNWGRAFYIGEMYRHPQVRGKRVGGQVSLRANLHFYWNSLNCIWKIFFIFSLQRWVT